jgi:hypothetical protein
LRLTAMKAPPAPGSALRQPASLWSGSSTSRATSTLQLAPLFVRCSPPRSPPRRAHISQHEESRAPFQSAAPSPLDLERSHVLLDSQCSLNPRVDHFVDENSRYSTTLSPVRPSRQDFPSAIPWTIVQGIISLPEDGTTPNRALQALLIGR